MRLYKTSFRLQFKKRFYKQLTVSLKCEISFTLEYEIQKCEIQLKIISHFYISYSNVNESSHCKDIANCILENAFWVAAWRWLYKEAETCRWFNCLLCFIQKDWKLVYILLIIENTTRMLRLTITNTQLLLVTLRFGGAIFLSSYGHEQLHLLSLRYLEIF